MNGMSFNEEQLAELKECFVMFDRLSSGVIHADDLGRALRALGQNPSNKEVTSLLQQSKVKDGGQLNYEQFLRAAASYGLKSESSMKGELTEALRVFDPNEKGFINANEFRTALKTFGEGLNDEEIEELVKAAGNKEGETSIDYMEFVKKVTSK